MTPMWNVEYTDQFEDWWNELTEDEQQKTDIRVAMLQDTGPQLGRPYVNQISNSRR